MYISNSGEYNGPVYIHGDNTMTDGRGNVVRWIDDSNVLNIRPVDNIILYLLFNIWKRVKSDVPSKE